jgi:thiol-disulfide isomerase/thioredoxin
MRIKPRNFGSAALIAGLLLLGACNDTSTVQNKQGQPPSAPTQANAGPDDEGQLIALNAGKSLIGKPTPALTFKTIDGTTVDLGKLLGKRPIYLKFWATWCIPCRQQMPAFKDDFARYGSEVEIFAINTGFNDDLAAVEAYRRELALPMPITIDDGKFAKAFNLRVTPQLIVIGRDGRILYVGHAEDDHLHAAIKAAIAQPVGLAKVVSTTNAGDGAPPAPQSGIHLTSSDGRSVMIGGHSDHATRILLFLSPWCEGYLEKSRPADGAACRAAREAVSKSAKTGQSEVVGIASGLWADADAVTSFVSKTSFPAPVVLDKDGALFRRYGVNRVPTVVEMDREGRVIRRFDPTEKDFGREISRIGGGQP